MEKQNRECRKTVNELTCSNCLSTEHLRRDCPSVKCHACGRKGHYKDDCPKESKRSRAEEETEVSVCRSCGSSRHVQAACPVRSQSMECFQCHQRGHMMPTCPQTRCFNCGVYGHSSQLCHSQPLCFHCSLAGHVSTACPMKLKGRVCYQCKEPGHDAADCPQGVLCRLCNRPGHLFATCPETLCNNCHEKGHIASSCAKSRHRHAQSAAHGGDESRSNEPLTPRKSPSDGEAEAKSESTPSTIAAEERTAIPAFVMSGAAREGRVAVIIDGGYFERTLRDHGRRDEAHYRRTTESLRYTLHFIGEIFRRDPFAYWFDTDPAAFTEYIEKSMPLPHRENAFRESNLRRHFLTDEMNGGRQLSNVVARLVGRMKRQKGYTRDGPGHVWVQTGIDVAMATCLIETFMHRQFQQVVLLCGDSDVYPAVQYCHMQRRTAAALAECSPVRVCGTSSSMSKLYGQDQDLSDFLPRILLDMPKHVEEGREVEFPTSVAFM